MIATWFYISPPKDLKDLYATQFEKGEEMLSLNLQTNNGSKAIKYRNYLKGRPTNFKIEVYQQYFPGVKNTNDLQRAARILSQGWGSFSVAAPLASYMN